MSNFVKSEILLESGTNEIEIMEFKINNSLFGINVAKVREIMMSAPVTSMPLTHPAVEGVFKPRDTVITVFDLPKYLYGDNEVHGEKDLFIITYFNKLYIAFRVTSVEGIYRISWSDLQKPDKALSGGQEGIATGIVQLNGSIVTILDFEKIVSEVSPSASIQVNDINNLGRREKNSQPIVIAEDSIVLSRMIVDSLSKAGFTNITKFDNGQDAWEYLESLQNKEDLSEKVSLVITDIEMPTMDGHRLTKLIKSNYKLKNIPVIIFSSMISEELYKKGKQLGADEQISKPEIGELVGVIDALLEKYKSRNK